MKSNQISKITAARNVQQIPFQGFLIILLCLFDF